mmetsp:Transcript_8958/g.36561  ORF Transcript_8958/g.36561 Transcript_8958/m.36561 type:complete len:441 (+) Transcript_8958:3775-5097(+)
MCCVSVRGNGAPVGGLGGGPGGSATGGGPGGALCIDWALAPPAIPPLTKPWSVESPRWALATFTPWAAPKPKPPRTPPFPLFSPPLPPPILPPRPPTRPPAPRTSSRVPPSAKLLSLLATASSSSGRGCPATASPRAMVAAYLLSFGVSSTCATPCLLPARPVRPMRCVWLSASLDASRHMTVFRSGTSRPLAARLVATSTCASPFLSAFTAAVRSGCERSPCTPTALTPAICLSFSSTSSTRARVDAKTITPPSSIAADMLAINHLSFASASRTTCTSCRTSALAPPAPPAPPTVMRTGARSAPAASDSSFGGRVAEKSSVCLSGLQRPMMAFTCSLKPIDSIESASSNTSKVTRCISVALPRSTSIRRPGVATMASTPALSSLYCAVLSTPPYTVLTVQPSTFRNRRTTVAICAASSRLGASTSAVGPARSASRDSAS